MIARMGAGVHHDRAALETEACRLETEARQCERRHRSRRQYYGTLDWVVGLLVIVSAVAAGTTALTDYSKTLTAAIAFAGALLTAFQTRASPAGREQSHRQRMADCGAIAERARILRTVELSELETVAVITELKKLWDEFHKVRGRPTFTD
jgi:hypothetical protein